jgi:hypothetical protein
MQSKDQFADRFHIAQKTQSHTKQDRYPKLTTVTDIQKQNRCHRQNQKIQDILQKHKEDIQISPRGLWHVKYGF